MTAAQTKLDKLDTLLAQPHVHAGCGALCRNVVASERRTLSDLELAPQQRRQRTLEALIDANQGITRQSPVLMIFEDVHWVDPTSLEALIGRWT